MQKPRPDGAGAVPAAEHGGERSGMQQEELLEAACVVLGAPPGTPEVQVFNQCFMSNLAAAAKKKKILIFIKKNKNVNLKSIKCLRLKTFLDPPPEIWLH